jgi:putative holliday junction resolvase
MSMRVLAVDHGNARAGLAVCDPSETVTRPLDVVEPVDAAVVARVAAEEGAELIVVGLPLSLGGSEGEQARVARAFAAELAGLAEVPVETYDERLTTRMATETARAGAAGAPDSIAAAHLLDGYLMSRRGSP